MRYSFANTLLSQARRNSNIVLLTGDLGYTVFEQFQKEFPHRFFNVGVSEQNMIGIATGLALTGKIVFAYSIASFVTMRPFEHIRNDIALHRASVVIVGSGGGLSYSTAGITHHAIEDISLMRSIPNMTVLCPADPMETEWATRCAIALKKPVYLRLGKSGEPVLYLKKRSFTLGKGEVLVKGTEVAIIATGNSVVNALKVAKNLLKHKIFATVVSMHTIKPLDSDLIRKLLKENSLLVSVEEHNIIGGLGSAIAEVASGQKHKSRLVRIGIADRFVTEIGSHAYLQEQVGLDPAQIAQRILSELQK